MCRVLVLVSCDKNLTSYKGFKWSDSGHINAPEKWCGLYGFMWGQGDWTLANWSDDAKWIICEVDSENVVGLKRKFKSEIRRVKFPECDVVFCGDRLSATNYLHDHLPPDLDVMIMGANITTGDYGTSSSGYRGISISGDHGSSFSGYKGISKCGKWGRSVSGDQGKSDSGQGGMSISGYWGISTTGDYWGESVSGTHGTSISGKAGTSISGEHGMAKSGDLGIIKIQWYDPESSRFKVLVGKIGEDGLELDTFYRVDNGKFVKCE